MDKRILIVDDSPSWRKFHTALISSLKPRGIEILTAESASEGLKIIEENKHQPFDVIISDLQMETDYEPDTAGEWLIQKVKQIKEYKKTRIIIISAMYNIESIANNLNISYVKKQTLTISVLPLKLKLEEFGIL